MDPFSLPYPIMGRGGDAGDRDGGARVDRVSGPRVVTRAEPPRVIPEQYSTVETGRESRGGAR